MEKDLIFTSGFVYRRNIIYIRAVLQELEMKDRNHAFMFRWMDGKWSQWAVDRRIVDHGAYDIKSGRVVILVSNDGHIQVGDSKGFRWEKIDETNASPNNLRSLKCLSKINDFFYVAGMSRMVYRKSLKGTKWERFDQGVRVPRSSKEIAGFNAISGFNGKNIYAAGLSGQVWRYNGIRWRQLSVGTNLGLYDIEIVSPKTIYMCGVAGIVLKGFGDQWVSVTNDVTDFDFYSIAQLNNRIFLSTNQNKIFEIINDEVVPSDLGLENEVTTSLLHSNDNVLVSVGCDHILIFDGTKWHDIGRPNIG